MVVVLTGCAIAVDHAFNIVWHRFCEPCQMKNWTVSVNVCIRVCMLYVYQDPCLLLHLSFVFIAGLLQTKWDFLFQYPIWFSKGLYPLPDTADC